MSDHVTIRLEPLGESFEVSSGTPLRDILFAHGVEFPCGGHGKCRKCRVKLLSGELPPAEDEREILTPTELSGGWRLACRAVAEGDITLEIDQWETTILADDTRFSFTPRSGLAIAVDVGTTTLVAQLVDLEKGHVLGVRSALNPQSAHGGDIMTRVQTALEPAGRATLVRLIRGAVADLIDALAPGDRLTEVVLVGNTVMHNLFCDIDTEPLSRYPFQAAGEDLVTFTAGDLDWRLPSDPMIQFLPCLGSFVGSDILAGLLASGLDQADELTALLDLGTNGEIVVGNRHRIICASTAAGPAFEGGRISMGMRAATGAIAEASIEGEQLRCHVLGDVVPRGICGSGLVDVVAAGLDLGRIAPSGRFTDGTKEWPLCEPVTLLQKDVRELQLAKGAVASGLRLLAGQFGAEPRDITRAYLAGAFGNYIDRDSARRIGLIELPLDKVTPAGNTALLGAKLVLFRTEPDQRDFASLRRRVAHVSLADDPAFQDTYVAAMTFP